MSTPIEAFRKLLDFYSVVFDRRTNDHYELQKCLREGKEIPDHCLPGRALKLLSEEERESLKHLTSDEVSKERLF